ncbi:MAG: TraR/DksA family transcriptional regulator [Xanthomonadaceae bacterium]|mgnify:CR=1 FL=1|nr:TraR/DksA family transcriptional regulator [Xanthomonadaceae bacterium]
MAERLSAEELREFEALLRQRHWQLRQEIHQTLMESDDIHWQELAGRVHDPGDESVADLITDLNIRQLDQQVQELHAVESALARQRNGSYGICADCGREIRIERLRAIPTAIRCIDCQSRYERDFTRSVPSAH